MKRTMLLLMALQLTGCATARTLDAAQPGAPVVYAGTRVLGQATIASASRAPVSENA